MQEIDIAEIIGRRTGKPLCKAAAACLRKIVHQSELNEILRTGENLSPKDFIDHTLSSLDVDYDIIRTAGIPTDGRYIFAANHPLGSIDGMIIARALLDEYSDVGVIVNDMLAYIPPLKPLWIPVNKYGRQNSDIRTAYETALASPTEQILTFPAGFCSRRIDGRIADTCWKPRFIRDALQYHRKIVPVFVDGRLSERFYSIYSLRTKLGIRTNIELALLADEMFRQRGKRIRIIFGSPVDVSAFEGSIEEVCNQIRQTTYKLQNIL